LPAEVFLREPVVKIAAIVAVCLAADDARAAARAFDFKDPKGINALVLVLDAPLEPMVATVAGVSGSMLFDPGDPKSATARIVVDAGTLQFASPAVTSTARGPDGLDVARFPTIEFLLKEVKNLRAVGPSRYAATVAGDFQCRGVTRRLTVPAEVSYLPGKASERNHSPGDLVVLRSTFKIRRRDFGIKPSKGDKLVGEEVEVRLAIAGTAPEEKPVE
jgi:polyisoprenoid-binding protein YceI